MIQMHYCSDAINRQDAPVDVGLAPQHDFLLRVYRAARVQPARRFEHTVLRALEPLLRFDAAFWGCGRVANDHAIRLHTAYLHHMTIDHLAEWQASSVQERMLARWARTPGAYAVLRRRSEGSRRATAASCAIGAQIDDRAAIVTAVLSADCSAQWLVLYRRRPIDSFSARDRREAARLIPHLFEARTISYALQCQRVLATAAAGAANLAFCDRHGVLAHADAHFVDLLRLEWPAWPGGRLPAELAELLHRSRGDSAFAGKHIRVFARPAGDTFCLIARQRAHVDLLTPREREVASRFAGGQTYKAIARQLAVAPATVRNQLASVYGKLGTHSKIELSRIVERA